MKGFRIKSYEVILSGFLSVGWFLVCTTGQAPDSSISPMEKKEQEALYSAIQGFVGDWWNGSDLYPDPCGWTPIQGVSCDLFNGYWYVTTISIGPMLDNSLKCNTTAKFSHHLFELNHLKSLSFFNCFLSPTQNPTKIPSSGWTALCDSLESLEFRSNPGLVGTVPLTLGHLKQLRSLVLIENGLSGNVPMKIGNLINLKRLVLAGNQFTGEIPASLGGLTELLILDSSRNFLSGSLPLAFGRLTSLLKLDLSNNKFEGSLPNEIAGLRNLTLLDLGRNNISGGLVQSLEEMTSLKEMVMSNNPLGGDLMGIQWKNLQNLEILDLSNISLTGVVPDSMVELTRLRFLGLSDNNLSGEVSPLIAAMPNLCALYLHGNNFTGTLDFPVGFYARMGRRFGAWSNPNICYKAQSVSKGGVPYGVKPC